MKAKGPYCFVLMLSLLGLLLGTDKALAQVKPVIATTVVMAGSMADGEHTPFWQTSQQYGTVPLDANNTMLRGLIEVQGIMGSSIRYTTGLDLIGSTSRYRKVYLQQLYASLGYRCFALTVGSKEKHRSLWNQSLSSGDLMWSGNARPIPEIEWGIPRFTPFLFSKGWLQAKGSFSVGKSFDEAYLEETIRPNEMYIKDVLWHYKSFYLRLADMRGSFPFSLTIGAQHAVQWGGTSTDSKLGQQPDGVSDFIRIVMGSNGGSDSSESSQVNALGNHVGSYDLKLSYNDEHLGAAVYYQHYWDTRAGMQFLNGTDGLWGLQLDFPEGMIVNHVVVEYLRTTDQSGPFHFIDFDHTAHQGPGGGRENYYLNEEYRTGYTYFGRHIGTPQLLSPVYNGDGNPIIRSNRVKNWHIGWMGLLSDQWRYRALFTWMHNWGLPMHPLLKEEKGMASLLEVTYAPKHFAGWQMVLSGALDTGTLLGESKGLALRLSKQW